MVCASDGPGEIGNQNAGRGKEQQQRKREQRQTKAIMTTDTKKKEAAVTFEIGGKTVTIGGMSKGSGMIHPNMCTMLAFLTTDAAITKKSASVCVK